MSNDGSQPPVNYYRLLGVPYSASAREITRAYRDKMKRTHPDTVSQGQRLVAEEHAKLLNLAMRTLTRPAERRAYDQTLKAELVQDQIMSQYFGGMGMPGGQDDRYGESLRRERTAQERQEMRQTDRSAIVSVLLVFGGATALVVCLLVVWAAVSALARALL